MYIINTNYFTYAFTIIVLLIMPQIFAQEKNTYDLNLLKTGVYLDMMNIEWKPTNNDFDKHLLELSQFKIDFSNMELSLLSKAESNLVKLSFKGPNISLVSLSIKSNILSQNWITREKINRLEKRRSIPDSSIKLIANAVDLYVVDNKIFPENLNDLIVGKYISRDFYPLNDYKWSYSLELPERIIAIPLMLNNLSNKDALYYDWQSKKIQLDPYIDSLFNVPLASWNYKFDLEDLNSDYTSNIELNLFSNSKVFDIIMKYGKFKMKNVKFSATPNNFLNDRTTLHIPELMIQCNDLILHGSLKDVPTLHKISGKFRTKNIHIKIPEGLIEDSEIQSTLEQIGIWNNSITIRLIEIDIKMINEFTAEISLKLNTPFLRALATGKLDIRQSKMTTDIHLRNSKVEIKPISLGLKTWIKKWERDKRKSLKRKGSTIILRMDGPIFSPSILMD